MRGVRTRALAVLALATMAATSSPRIASAMHAVDPPPGDPSVSAENRVWGFFSEECNPLSIISPLKLEGHWGIRSTSTACASGSRLFLQRDPHGYEDSVNLYAGFRWDPVNLRDPTGEAACGGLCIAGVAVAVVGLAMIPNDEDSGPGVFVAAGGAAGALLALDVAATGAGAYLTSQASAAWLAAKGWFMAGGAPVAACGTAGLLAEDPSFDLCPGPVDDAARVAKQGVRQSLSQGGEFLDDGLRMVGEWEAPAGMGRLVVEESRNSIKVFAENAPTDVFFKARVLGDKLLGDNMKVAEQFRGKDVSTQMLGMAVDAAERQLGRRLKRIEAEAAFSNEEVLETFGDSAIEMTPFGRSARHLGFTDQKSWWNKIDEIFEMVVRRPDAGD